MFAALNEGPADAATETGVSGEVFLPLGEAMLIDLEHDLLRWKMASNTIVRRARRFNAVLRDKVGTLLDNEEGAVALWLSVGLMGVLGFAAL